MYSLLLSPNRRDWASCTDAAQEQQAQQVYVSGALMYTNKYIKKEYFPDQDRKQYSCLFHILVMIMSYALV